MKALVSKRPGSLRSLRTTVFSAGLLLLSGAGVSQDGMSLEDLEKLVEEQRIALEEAIANRESTAAQVEEVQNDLEESEARSQEVIEELEGLCKEQEALQEGSFDDCMASEDS